MTRQFLLSKENWDIVLSGLLPEYDIFAPVPEGEVLEYAQVGAEDMTRISYNIPKPTSPLKTFFLPVKEKVTGKVKLRKKRIILGIPACDLRGLDLLDEIYLDESYPDPFYRMRRENTLLIGTDCHSHLEHCHCTSYGLNPFPEKNFDLCLSVTEGQVYLTAGSDKGLTFVKQVKDQAAMKDIGENEMVVVHEKRKAQAAVLKNKNRDLPGYERTGVLMKGSDGAIWEKYAKDCVSCGACATICPTCTCFLLIDQPDFHKVKQLDACQYPGFEKVAAGEDPLGKKPARFRNRYNCKYLWKPEKFKSLACTGCGRCIEACIGAINKNELFLELTK